MQRHMLHSKNAMPINDMKTEYKQRLPHIQPVGAAFFVTFRLFGSVPKSDILTLKEKYEKKINEIKIQKFDAHQQNLKIFNLRKQYLVEYDALLHKINSGPMHLSDSNLREILQQQLHRFDNELYSLICYCIMSNHVHILIDTSIQLSEISDDYQIDMNYKQLDVIMKKIKGPSAWYSNKYLNKHGQFWERESFDIYIRNEKMLQNVISYILENPVKARMVEKWDDYPGNYLKP
jgi:putative transposase